MTDDSEKCGITRCSPLGWLNPFLGDKLKEDTLVEVVEGFRCWRVFPDIVPLRLCSYFSHECVWEPGKKMVAACRGHLHIGHIGHFEGVCNAGVYALKSLDMSNYMFAAPTDSIVVGKIAMWGRILDCALGYRAEFAYPSAIFNISNISARLAEIYGVPLVPSIYPLPSPDWDDPFSG